MRHAIFETARVEKTVQTLNIPNSPLQVSRIAYECMEISRGWQSGPLPLETRRRALAAVHAALDAGVNFFDHVDI